MKSKGLVLNDYMCAMVCVLYSKFGLLITVTKQV